MDDQNAITKGCTSVVNRDKAGLCESVPKDESTAVHEPSWAAPLPAPPPPLFGQILQSLMF